jgi:DNA-binding NarL/FixJ family response regulator
VPVRVFHGDDSDSYRLLIAETLPGEGDIEVVGGAGTADEVVAGVQREQPDVVLLDQLPGAQLVERVRSAAPGVRVVILSGYASGAGNEELERGADAYVVKSAPVTVLAAAVINAV